MVVKVKKSEYKPRAVSKDIAPEATRTMLSKRRAAAGGRTAAELPPRTVPVNYLFEQDEVGDRIMPERIDPGSPRSPVISSMISDKLKRRRGAATRRTTRRRSGAPSTVITETDKIG